MINLANYLATRNWNIDRNYIKFDAELENKMLEEEKAEFFLDFEKYTALGKNTPECISDKLDAVVGIVDALCDFIFVFSGTETKVSLSNMSLDDKAKYSIIRITAERDMNLMMSLTLNILGQKFDIDTCYDMVVEANNLKPSKTNADGKGVKGDKWVDPKHKIKQYLIDLGCPEYI